MKAFVISISAITLILTLVIFFNLLNNQTTELERALAEPIPLIYAKMVVSSIGYEIANIGGPELTIIENNETIKLLINEELPKASYSSALNSYVSFIAGNFSDAVNADINVNVSNLTNGSIRAYLFEDYIYENNYTGQDTILFGTYDENGSANASVYVINISVLKYRAYVKPFTFGSGDMNVTINYKDLNGTVSENGLLNSAGTNVFSINYYYQSVLSTVEVEVGRVRNRQGALFIRDINASSDVGIEVTIPKQNASKHVRERYEAMINYVQNNVNKTSWAMR